MSCITCSNCGFVNLLSAEPSVQNSLQAIRGSEGLVSQLLRGSRSLLDADRAFIDAEIAELERVRSLYDAQLQELQLRRPAVLEALESRASIYAPIRRIPRDILIEIFHLVCDSASLGWDKWVHRAKIRDSLDLSGPLWVLGRVCALWRDTLHSSPASWARNVVVHCPFSKRAPEILHFYLKRTGEHPLSLRVVINRSGNPIKDGEIMSLLIQSAYRWKDVHIDITVDHIHHLDSIAKFPALQTVQIDVLDDHAYDHCSEMCLKAPQLWKAAFPFQRIHRVRLPPGITHCSICITCAKDLQHISHLPKFRTCHLRWSTLVEVKPPVVMTELRHLYVDLPDTLDFLTAPLLESLTISQSLSQGSACVTSFLHRSGCHLESLSYGMPITSFSWETQDLISNMLSSEACSTISRLKLEFDEGFDKVAEALTPSSVLPNLHHLILCLRAHVNQKKWSPMTDMLRSRRDARLIKTVELQFTDDGYKTSIDCDIVAEVRGLAGDNLEIRVEEWDPPSWEPLFIFY
ncbi:hypothetical protein EV421DRAFT_1845239 [Armillaria borealis]|uniref:F-box domain-containing protein n=1 Tax=Armillaria borealis TaxID=47425 RepID=A0AA39J0N2_9AGAR|nr:hypothetical protein EV421DRAFT_1845239 [Armillaria borealis]